MCDHEGEAVTDEFQAPDPIGESEAVDLIPEEESPEEADFTSGEGLVALAGIIILAVWIILRSSPRTTASPHWRLCWRYLQSSFPESSARK